MGDPKFYAVQAGHQPGVYTSWKDCFGQIRGFKGAKFKSFTTANDAQMYIAGTDPSLDPTSSSYTARFYGVRSGKVPGVYTDWASAEQQVKGVQKPKVKCFPTREEAEAFVSCDTTVAKDTEAPPRRTVPQQQQAPPPPPPPSSDEEDLEILPGKPKDFSSHEPEDVPTVKKRKKRKSVESPLTCEVDTFAETIAHTVDERYLPTITTTTAAAAAATTAAAATAKSRTKKNPVLRIYTDGSALSNGHSGSNAGVGVWFGDQDTRNISEPLAGPRQTNQRAELTAILRALNVAPTHRDVQIFTDSQYAIKCVTVWHHAWMRNNWITSVGRPVENRDLVQQIVAKMRERESLSGAWTRFEWVKGHTGQNDGNSQADRLAVEGARMGRAAAARGLV